MNVSASIMSLSFEAPGRGKATYDEEVFNMKVAMTEERAFRLAGGEGRIGSLTCSTRKR